ncbi:MAG: type II site-specific deoxyribonuclease, partial [Dolichospermum sp.]
NKLLSKSVTTHHHLNLDILAKYRAVKAWYIAVYEGIVLKAIYKIEPNSLEVKFSYWESRIRGGMNSINNPKIPLSLIEKEGELVYLKQN